MERELFTRESGFVRIEMPEADVSFLCALALAEPAEAVMARLVEETAWRTETVRLWGKVYPQPRLVAWYGDAGASYAYSGRRFEPLPWTPLLADLKARVEGATEARFNSVLLNFYRDGCDSMGWHADDEKELGSEPVIASLSLGATRTFAMKHRRDRGQRTRRLELPSASLLLMRGPTQRCWLHAVPKTRKPCGPRVNLTFRLVDTPVRGEVTACGRTRGSA